MILTDYYYALKDSTKKTRYDVVSSSGSYDYFESLFVNKKEPNKGGLAFYIVDQPSKWGKRAERKADKAMTKAQYNISSVLMPDPKSNVGFGDVKNTHDALLFVMNDNWTVIEVFVARGQIQNKLNLYQLCMDGELDEEMEILRSHTRHLGNKSCNRNC